MAGTRTGKGGFEIDGRTHDFDVGDPNAENVDFGATDRGDIRVDDTPKDISRSTRRTLAQYLSDATLGKHGGTTIPNSFPVSPEHVDVSITDPTTGLPNRLSDASNVPQFAPRSALALVLDVPQALRPDGPVGAPRVRDTFDDPALALTDLGKGRQGRPVDGHSLLRGVSKNSPGPIIGGYTSRVLANNRFSPDGARISDSTSVTVGGRTYGSNQVKSLGAMLSLRASQEFPAAFNDSVNPQNAGSIAGALLPSPNQLGALKIPKVLLEARDALEHISDNADAPTEVTISPIGNQSWGALNNVEEPWSGTLNVGMIAMALALQAAMLVAFQGLGALIGFAGNGASPPAPARNPNGTYTKGSYLATPLANPGNVGFPPNVMAMLGVHGTRFPFADALRVGASAFFVGAENAKKGLGSQLVGAVTSTLTSALSDNSSAGYVIIVSRTIVRTGQTIAAQVEKIADAFASNPLSGVKSIAGLLDVIKGSKLVAAINIFTMLGDAILSEGEYGKDSSGPTEVGVSSDADAIDPDSPGAAVRKSRIKNPKNAVGSALKLAWASNRSPASYLLPDSIATMTLVDAKLGSFRGPLGVSDPDSRGYVAVQTEADRLQNGARIPQRSPDPGGIDVQKMEALLDSEYVPFYFHDLRTNEITSFHAFLASLTDDFTPGWETIDGYGRVDPVKIYKSTARRITMSFYVAATDRNDFDEVWVRINKLITLVYPQYTKGRTLTDGQNHSFVQPFSQLIGASPLIRLRLGDLLRSNYSRFALARLFGAGDGDMMLSSQRIRFEGAQAIIKDPVVAKHIIGLVNKAREDPASEYNLSTAGWAAAMEPAGLSISVGVGGSSTPDQAVVMRIDEGDLGYFKFRIKKTMSNGMVAVAPEIKTPTDLVDHGFDSATASTLVKSLTSKYASSKNPNTKVVGGVSGYAVPVHALRLSTKTLGKLFGELGGVAAAVQSVEQLSAFLDAEKNALVKSFAAIQGKGLAGVIEALNFDWYDKVTWEVDPGSCAPKMCKVSITFAPIHDISPGIDHLGYNRAPVYPVGSAMGGR